MKRTRMKSKRRRSIPGLTEAAAKFAGTVLWDDEGRPEPCVACGAQGPREAHHAVPKSVLWEICRYDLRLSDREALAIVYAPEVGVPLCSPWTPNRCHERQTSMAQRVDGARLPERVLVFAQELGERALRSLETQHPGATLLPVNERNYR